MLTATTLCTARQRKAPPAFFRERKTHTTFMLTRMAHREATHGATHTTFMLTATTLCTWIGVLSRKEDLCGLQSSKGSRVDQRRPERTTCSLQTAETDCAEVDQHVWQPEKLHAIQGSPTGPSAIIDSPTSASKRRPTTCMTPGMEESKTLSLIHISEPTRLALI
eukprot:7787626-Alexandrium_andersonii.AAC.1